MKQVQVLGTGCAKCAKLAKLAQDAVDELGIEAEVTKVEDMNQILSFGVMVTPALVVDGEVKSAGSLPSTEAIKQYLA